VAVTSTPTATGAGGGVDEREERQMRRYDDPVEVRRGETEGPEQFLWRGRLWKVRSVLAHWVETAPWWQGDARSESESQSGPAPHLDLVAERELWRVEAGRGTGLGASGVFDLSFDWSDGSWRLVGCLD